MKHAENEIIRITTDLAQQANLRFSLLNQAGDNLLKSAPRDFYVVRNAQISGVSFYHDNAYFKIIRMADTPLFFCFTKQVSATWEQYDSILETIRAYVEAYFRLLLQKNSSIDILNGLLMEILLNDVGNNADQLLSKAQFCHFDAEQKRRLVLVDPIGLKSLLQKNMYEEQLNGLMETLEEDLHRVFHHNHDYVLYLNDDKFIIFSSINDERLMSHLEQLAISLKDHTKVDVQFIVSDLCQDITAYHTEYMKLQAVHKLFYPRFIPAKIYYVGDYEIELVIADLLNHQTPARSPLYALLLQIYQSHPLLIETFMLYFKSNMDYQRCAEQLFIHRNTVHYRITNLSKSLHLDLRKSYYASQVFILCCLIGIQNAQSIPLDLEREQENKNKLATIIQSLSSELSHQKLK